MYFEFGYSFCEVFMKILDTFEPHSGVSNSTVGTQQFV